MIKTGNFLRRLGISIKVRNIYREKVLFVEKGTFDETTGVFESDVRRFGPVGSRECGNVKG